MRPLVTPDEMAAADRATIDSGTPVDVLMDRAGRAVARSAIRMLGGRYRKKVVIVCGKGSNGGDGYVAERVLRREGVAAYAVPADNFDPTRIPAPDLVIDAIYGTGFHGAAHDPAIDWIEECGAQVLSVDIPSGVDGLTGGVQGVAVHADMTIAIAAQKIGTAVGAGAIHAGLVEVVDIGIPVPETSASMADRAWVSGVLPRREADSHKRSRGSVAILGGSAGMSGAVILAARGAMRAGAGYVTAGVTEAVQPLVAGGLAEAVTSALTVDDTLGPQALDEFKPVLERATALAIGPGLGGGDGQRDLVLSSLRAVQLPVVLDADGLNVLAGHTNVLSDRESSTVITPHPVELARLLEVDLGEVQNDRVKAVRAAARRFGCVVVLKGFRTLIAAGDRLVVNPTGGTALATAGTGDVLTGVIATFLAQGLAPFDAAVVGTYVHGLAGDISGDEGVLAGDVAESIASALELLL